MHWYTIFGLTLATSFLTLIIIEVGRLIILGRRTVVAGKRITPASREHLTDAKRILIVGDSTSFGTGASKTEHTIAGRLINDLPDFTIINISENALRTADMRRKLSAVHDQSFDMVLIHTGGMDTVKLTPLRTLQKELQALCADAKSLGAPLVVLVSVNNTGSVPFFRFPLDRLFSWRSRQVSLTCHEVAQTTDVLHVPLYSSYETDPLRTERGWHIAEDHIHPNDTGYEIWYNHIRSAILPYIERLK